MTRNNSLKGVMSVKLLITHDLTPQQLEQVRLTAREHMIVYTQEHDLALAEAKVPISLCSVHLLRRF